MKGIELSRRFYVDLIRPWLLETFPNVRHAAALIGYGSELLGFDDEMSQDHNWGPRVWLYVGNADFYDHADAIVSAFAEVVPDMFLGVPTAFYSRPLAPSRGVGARGDIRHGLEVWTLDAALDALLALKPGEPHDNFGWLGLSEQRLLAMTTGAVFHDDDENLTQLRAHLAYYPDDVWLYKLASQWSRIGQEQAFVGRAGSVGDDIGSRIIAARLVRDVMRMAFLLERRYAPYAKWFGSAFAQLPCSEKLSPLLAGALAATHWQARERALADAYLVLGRLHRTLEIPGDFVPQIGLYFDRPFMVINADEMADAIRLEIRDPEIKSRPLVGSLDQVIDSTPLVEMPHCSRRVMEALLSGLLDVHVADEV